jgi:hypothetical protein
MPLALVYYSEGIAAHLNHFYLTESGDSFQDKNRPEKWYGIGLLQNFDLEFKADDFIPKINFGVLGVNIREVKTPEFQDGGFIFYLANFYHLGDELHVNNIPLATNCYLGITRNKPLDQNEHPIYGWLPNYADVMGGVSKCAIKGGVGDGITIEITIPQYPGLDPNRFHAWVPSLPPWIKLHKSDIDTGETVNEIGTDGHIDTAHE